MRYLNGFILLCIGGVCVVKGLYAVGAVWLTLGSLVASWRLRVELVLVTLRLALEVSGGYSQIYWYPSRGGVSWGVVRGRFWMSHWLRLTRSTFSDFARAARTTGLRSDL